MAKWFMAAKKADFEQIGKRFHIDPVIARLIRNRDICTPEEIEIFLCGDRSDLYSPFLLKDMDRAVDAVLKAISRRERIRVIGDYDIDGVCATHILRRGLRFLGADVDTAIPHRIRDGYGLNEQLIREAGEEGIRFILTCDNGIAAGEQIALAGELGISVIVTDHHEVPYEEDRDGVRRYLLPPAEAVIDPKREDCSYPFQGICGAVVAYKLIEALYLRVREQQRELFVTAQEPFPAARGPFTEGQGLQVMDERGYDEVLEELFELAAFATVGDVMELKDENRIFVKYGLEMMQQTKNTGLRALMQVNGIEGKGLSAYHIGFVLGPCLNASGRLDTAERALALLEETNETNALRLAGELKSLNDSRKAMTLKQVETACAMLEEQQRLDDVLILYLPDCHESLAGIVAGRVREKYIRPTFILTKGEEGVKGSGRSIKAYDMYAHMSRCKELFSKYGGHKMAAGLSMEEKDIEEFRRRMNAESGLTPEDFEERVHIDVPMPFSYVTRELVEELSVLEPFGNGNPRPLFAEKDMLFLSGKIFGKNRNVARFTVEDKQGQRYELIYFGDLPGFYGYVTKRFGEQAAESLGADWQTAESLGADRSDAALDRLRGTGGRTGADLKGTGGRQGANAGSRYGSENRTEETTGQDREVRLHVAYYPSLNEFRGRTSLEFVMQHYC